jgi:hypothetical protein
MVCSEFVQVSSEASNVILLRRLQTNLNTFILFWTAEFPADESSFKQNIQEYLFSPEGRHYLQDIKVDGSILDLQGNFTITVSVCVFIFAHFLCSTHSPWLLILMQFTLSVA